MADTPRSPRDISPHTVDPDFNFANLDPNMSPSRRAAVPFTVTPALRPTAYKEEWEPKERRTDAYLRVQIEVLQFLDAHAADELTPAQAHFFTENAGSKGAGPTAKQAVGLCYFMRSHGFDVYAKLVCEPKCVQLWLADQDAKDRSQDKLYWEQNLKTGAVKEMSWVERAARGGRRGALANIFEGA